MASGIVIGFDGTDGSRAALAVAIELASKLDEPLHAAYATAPPTHVGEEAREHRHALESIGRGLLGEALAAAAVAGVQAESHLEPAKPVELLIDLADRLDARMIVVGSYGESPLRGAILGSTPHKLLHLSERPVLAVPSPDSA